MAIRNIVLDGDPILKKKCREVTAFDEKLASLLDDMKETLANAEGLGLAGPQVGILRRVCVVLEIDDYNEDDGDIEEDEDINFDELDNGDLDENDAENDVVENEDDDEFDEDDDAEDFEDSVDGEFIEFVNPVIIETSGEKFGYEGCLSFPDRNAAITRPTTATVKAFDRNGNEFTRTLTGINARCICHECNHLDGITIVDLADYFYEDIEHDENK